MASNHPDSAWVVIFCDKTNRYCLGKRTDGLYDFFGGGVGCTESPRAAAIRELKEEASIGPDHPATKKFEPILKHKFGENTFYYFLMVVSEEFRPVVNDEHEGSVWLREDQIPYDLHLSTRIYFGKLWSRFMNAHKVYGKKVTASSNSDWLHYLLRILGAFAVEAEPKDEWIQNSISRKYQITQTMLDGLWKKDPSKYCLALSKILIDDVIPDVTLDHAVSKANITMLRDWSIYIRRNSEKAYDRFLTMLPSIREPSLVSDIKVDVPDQKSLGKVIRAFVKKHARLDLIEISPEDKKEWAARDPVTYSQYLKLCREYRGAALKVIKAKIRASGKSVLDVSILRDALNKAKIDHGIPEGFEGGMDEYGKFYTIGGKQLKSAPTGVVKMNDSYDEENNKGYVLTYKTSWSIKPIPVYTVEYRKEASTRNFAKAASIDIKKVRPKWGKDMMALRPNSKTWRALLVELSYSLASRIGTKLDAGTKDGTKTFGLTTLTVAHAKRRGNLIEITYPGKDGVIQHHQLKRTGSDKILKHAFDMTAKLLEGKKPKDFVFTYPDGERITATDVNVYFKKITGNSKVSIHKLRKVLGTRLAKEVLSESPYINSDKKLVAKEVMADFEERMKQVGELLGHKSTKNGQPQTVGSTAVAYYIEPNLLLDYFKNVGIRPPSKVINAANG